MVGYARVSVVGQSLHVQMEKLKGCDKIFKEKRTERSSNRPRLKACLEYVRDGDTLGVSRLDRLARSTPHLCQVTDPLQMSAAPLADRLGVALKLCPVYLQ